MKAKTVQKRTKKAPEVIQTVENLGNLSTPVEKQVIVNGGNEVTVIPVAEFKMIVPRRRGQPTKYRPIYCEWIVQYFEQASPVVAIVDDPGGKGGTQTRLETLRVPTLRGFAARIGVNQDTLYEWAKQHRDFSEALARAQALMHAMIEELGLAGRIGKGLAELYFTNHLGYKDTRHMDITSDDKPIVPITALQLNVNTPQKQLDQ